VQLTGDPVGLANALIKIEQHEHNVREKAKRQGYRMFAAPPLLRSHPDTTGRVERLLELAGTESALGLQELRECISASVHGSLRSAEACWQASGY
jgi:hypothetical protein